LLLLLLLLLLQVVFLDSLHEGPETLQQQGDKHLAAHHYQEAVHCYNNVLLSLQQQQQQQGGQLLLSVLLNLSATHLQLQQLLQALLYATAAVAVSCHKNSKAYYRAAVALDYLLGPSSSSSSSISVMITSMSQLVAAATELMEVSVQLTGNSTPAAKAQMLAALTNVATANSARQGTASSSSSSKKGASAAAKRGGGQAAAAGGAWQIVSALLATNVTQWDMRSCFFPSSSSSSGGTAGLLAAAGDAKEAGNTAFKQGSFPAALQYYTAALATLKTTDGPLIATLTSSRAKAWPQQPSQHSQQQACLDGLTAALLDPSQPSGFHTAATAHLQLDESSGAFAVCEVGMEVLPGAVQLGELMRRVHAAAEAAAAATAPAGPAAEGLPAAGAAAGASSRSSSATSSSSSRKKKGKGGRQQSGSSSSRGKSSSGMTERELKEFTNEGVSGVEQVAMMNEMMAMMARMDARGGGRGRGRGGGGGRGPGWGQQQGRQQQQGQGRGPGRDAGVTQG
jgi:tetratricopeptide (TPR) repeat protein